MMDTQKFIAKTAQYFEVDEELISKSCNTKQMENQVVKVWNKFNQLVNEKVVEGDPEQQKAVSNLLQAAERFLCLRVMLTSFFSCRDEKDWHKLRGALLKKHKQNTVKTSSLFTEDIINEAIECIGSIPNIFAAREDSVVLQSKPDFEQSKQSQEDAYNKSLGSVQKYDNFYDFCANDFIKSLKNARSAVEKGIDKRMEEAEQVIGNTFPLNQFMVNAYKLGTPNSRLRNLTPDQKELAVKYLKFEDNTTLKQALQMIDQFLSNAKVRDSFGIDQAKNLGQDTQPEEVLSNIEGDKNNKDMWQAEILSQEEQKASSQSRV